MQTIPEQRLYPYLAVNDAAAAIAWYGDHLGFTEEVRLVMGDKIGHAELVLGTARIAIADEFPSIGVVGPTSLGGTAVSLVVYVEDVDAVVEKAAAAGATIESAPKDEFFGDRAAKIVDPFGHRWMVHTRREEISVEELKRRFAEMAG